MKEARFYFHGALPELLSPSRRTQPVVCRFQGNQSAKHLIEALRIPHTEFGSVMANYNEVSPGYIVQDGDRIDVFSIKPSLVSCDGPQQFILDNHLGKLATYLRILGFDTAYCNRYQDDELAHISSHEQRILLTRDRGLLMRREVKEGYCVRSLEPKAQLEEVILRYNLADFIRPFQRCLRCNHPLEYINKADIQARLEPLTRQYFEEFHYCPTCDQIYWKGSHYDRMQELLSIIKSIEEKSDD
jgi:uncharacterized protein